MITKIEKSMNGFDLRFSCKGEERINKLGYSSEEIIQSIVCYTERKREGKYRGKWRELKGREKLPSVTCGHPIKKRDQDDKTGQKTISCKRFWKN